MEDERFTEESLQEMRDELESSNNYILYILYIKFYHPSEPRVSLDFPNTIIEIHTVKVNPAFEIMSSIL